MDSVVVAQAMEDVNQIILDTHQLVVVTGL
jgi:hypothetical protein